MQSALMNEDFKATSPDLTNVIDEFQNILIGNPNVTYKLATNRPEWKLCRRHNYEHTGKEQRPQMMMQSK